MSWLVCMWSATRGEIHLWNIHRNWILDENYHQEMSLLLCKRFLFQSISINPGFGYGWSFTFMEPCFFWVKHQIYHMITTYWLITIIRQSVLILFNVLPRFSNMLEQLKILNCFMDLDIQRAFAYRHILICFILAISPTSE